MSPAATWDGTIIVEQAFDLYVLPSRCLLALPAHPFSPSRRLDALCSISASGMSAPRVRSLRHDRAQRRRHITVLLFYDYLLTLDKEAGLFWKKKISGASLLLSPLHYN